MIIYKHNRTSLNGISTLCLRKGKWMEMTFKMINTKFSKNTDQNIYNLCKRKKVLHIGSCHSKTHYKCVHIDTTKNEQLFFFLTHSETLNCHQCNILTMEPSVMYHGIKGSCTLFGSWGNVSFAIILHHTYNLYIQKTIDILSLLLLISWFALHEIILNKNLHTFF